MNLICIGDNVTDCYVDEGICYPGGNCVNVAVNSKRLGIEDVNYIGIFGDDDKSSYIITACMYELIILYDINIFIYKMYCKEVLAGVSWSFDKNPVTI